MNTILLLAVLAAAPDCLKPGDVICTRNAESGDPATDNNPSPGYFNHNAIYVGQGVVVEAQMDPGEVIESTWDEFWNRYPVVAVIRPDRYDGVKAAEAAKGIVGEPYWLKSSIWSPRRWERRGMNCVSVARVALAAGLGRDPGGKIPDEISQVPGRLVLGKGVK